jgi:hypothetical protein
MAIDSDGCGFCFMVSGFGADLVGILGEAWEVGRVTFL